MEEIQALRKSRQAAKAAAQKRDVLDDVGFDGLRYDFNDGLTLHVQEDWHADDDGIAGLQWAGGMRLARFLDEESWKGKRVLELGAGCGLTSCLLAAKGAIVDCTDAEPSFAQATADLNAQVLINCTLRIFAYHWSNEKPTNDTYDVVLAGDCLYFEEHAEKLCQALEICVDTERTIAYVCGAVGVEAHASFIPLVQRSFLVEEHKSDGTWDEVVTWDKRALLRLTKLIKPPLSAIKPARKQALDQASSLERFGNCLQVSSASVITTSPISSSNIIKDVLVIDCVLSAQECACLVEAVQGSPELEFWAGSEKNLETRRFRDAQTLEVSLPSFAQIVWSRVKSHIEPWIRQNQGGSTLRKCNDDVFVVEEVEPSQWRLLGLNHDLLFASYPSGGGFAPHTDGTTRHGLNRRSFFSVIIYLNDCAQGGETRFHSSEAADHIRLFENRYSCRDSFALADVKPRAGRFLLFDQALVHEGQPPIYPYVKHIIRSDLIFERQPTLFDTPNDNSAYEAYDEACALAADNQYDKATLLFDRCRRLSPNLAARLLGV